MQGYQFIVGQHTQAIPWWWFDAMIAWLGVMGFLFWLFGRRMIKPLFMFIGLALGAAATVALLYGRLEQMQLLLSAIGGALVGAVAGFMLWRVGIGLVTGSAAAKVGVALAALAVGAGLPAYEAAAIKADEEVRQTLAKAAIDDIHADVQKTDITQVVPLQDLQHRAVDPFTGATTAWWNSVSKGVQWVIATAGIAAGLFGVILGMIFAKKMSAVVTALIGTTMMLPGLWRILELAPPKFAAAAPRTVVGVSLVIVAGTIIGTLIQWTILRGPADK